MQSREYPTKLDELAADIAAEHEQAQQHFKTALEHAIAAGQKLIEAKALVAHGQWLPWLAENFPLACRFPFDLRIHLEVEGFSAEQIPVGDSRIVVAF